MFSKVCGDPHIKDSLETEYCVRGGKCLIKQKKQKIKAQQSKIKNGTQQSLNEDKMLTVCSPNIYKSRLPNTKRGEEILSDLDFDKV